VIERRTHPRHRVYLGATLELNDGNSTFDCVIRNASRTGVRVSLASSVVAPDKAFLHVRKNGRRLPVHTAWRSQSACGLTFTRLSGDIV
jgi:hypothetical protein